VSVIRLKAGSRDKWQHWLCIGNAQMWLPKNKKMCLPLKCNYPAKWTLARRVYVFSQRAVDCRTQLTDIVLKCNVLSAMRIWTMASWAWHVQQTGELCRQVPNLSCVRWKEYKCYMMPTLRVEIKATSSTTLWRLNSRDGAHVSVASAAGASSAFPASAIGAPTTFTPWPHKKLALKRLT
jgi:hypothetical protein